MSNFYTKEGLEKMKQELKQLETVERKNIAKQLKHAISFGDLSENAAYEEAKEAQNFLEKKIFELRRSIKDAVLIKKGGTDKVQVGSTVLLIPSANPEEVEKYIIVSHSEIDPINGKISIDSPLGKAMDGLRKGDVFEMRNNSEEIKYKIAEIE